MALLSISPSEQLSTWRLHRGLEGLVGGKQYSMRQSMHC